MACMEHYCPKCGFAEFDNNPRGGLCPKCNTPLQDIFDELPELEHEEKVED